MSKIAMISAFLVSVGFGVEAAVTEAEALEKKIPGVKVVKPATRQGGVGQQVQFSGNERIIAYAQSRNGNVFSRASLSLALPTKDRRNVSTNLSSLVKRGILNRTGRGEYLLTNKG